MPNGRIVHYDDIEDLCEELGHYPLRCNGIQGQAAIDFCDKLHGLGVDVMLDVDSDDRCDTVVVSGLLGNDRCMEAFELIGKTRPDELTLYGADTFRLWWD